MLETDNRAVLFNNKLCSLAVIAYVNKANIIDDDSPISKPHDFSGLIHTHQAEILIRPTR